MRSVGATASALALGASATLLGATTRAEALTTDAGQWSAPFDLGGIAIHAAMMRNDEVLYFQYVEGDPSTDHESLVKTWNYRTGVSQLAPVGYHKDLFCAGMNFLPDGRLFASGGHDHTTGQRKDPFGVRTTDIYDPMTRTWTPGPELSMKRWYPTAIGMPNGHSYVFGGSEAQGVPSNTVDDYDPATNSIRTLPSTATRNLGDYPRLHLLGNGTVLKTGQAARSLFFRPATSTWVNGPTMRYGARQLGTSVQLPGLSKVLTFGGRASATAPATSTAEILDTSAATPAWRYTAPLRSARLHASAVVLPDGKVLAIGGGAGPGLYSAPVRSAEMFDPVTETWTTMASQQAQRMYHSTALLLPDGRVLSAGSDSGTQSTKAEIFSPPYLFRGARPSISSASATVGYGGQLTVTSPNTDISKLVLVRPGAVTHQIDTDQRHVALTFTSNGAGFYTATGPSSANVAPPGYYMLFALNAAGVPSVATWVRVG